MAKRKQRAPSIRRYLSSEEIKELQEIISDMYGSYTKFCQAAKISSGQFSRIINGHEPIGKNTMSDIYQLTEDERIKSMLDKYETKHLGFNRPTGWNLVIKDYYERLDGIVTKLSDEHETKQLIELVQDLENLVDKYSST